MALANIMFIVSSTVDLCTMYETKSEVESKRDSLLSQDQAKEFQEMMSIIDSALEGMKFTMTFFVFHLCEVATFSRLVHYTK